MHEIAIEFPARGEMRFAELGAPPEPGPSQILLETRYSGITNGTERHGLMDDHGFGRYPGRHGYQHVARVVAVGSEVTRFRPGDWVFYGQYVGHRGWHVVEIGDADPTRYDTYLTVDLPEELPRHDCALFGVAGVALRAVKRVRVAPEQKVWVVGAGPIGHFAAQCARIHGAEVTVSDVVPRRLEVALETGAHRTVDASSDGAWQALQEAGPFDRIIDGSGVPSLFDDIQQYGLLARQGAICAMAVRGETHFPWSLLHGRESSIEVACHFSLDELHELIEHVRSGALRIAPMVSHRVPIDRAPEIYATMRDRPRELLGVIFDWA